MIDWIDEAGKQWGATKRRIAFGGYWYANEGFHTDGFSGRAAITKLWEGRNSVNTVEVFLGEALAFEIGIQSVTEKWFALAHFRYVIPARWMPTKSKIMELKEWFPRTFKDERAYYNEIHGLHCFMLGRMPDVPRGTNPVQTARIPCAEDTCNMSAPIKVVSA